MDTGTNIYNYIKKLTGLVFIIVCGKAFSQQTVIDQFNSYEKKAIQEKLFLHSDKEFYVAGEILWFKLYYADGTTHQPLQLSRVAYVEILDEKNQAVLQAKISLSPGDCKGSFYIPTSMKTGSYIMRAYTSWMKNFGVEYFFEKQITIVNTLQAPGNINDSNTNVTEVIADFFPEGGTLVADIQSKVGFRVTDDKGGINTFTGYIIDKNSDTITTFFPLKFGIGSFDFKPVKGNTYEAAIVIPGKPVIKKTLPEISDNGYAMSVKDKGADQLEVSVLRKKMPGEETTEQILLAVHKRQKLCLAEIASINDNGVVSFLLEKKKISEGVIYFTLFTASGKPLCERLVYIKPSPTAFLKISGDKNEYGTRQKINLFFNVQDNKADSIPYNLSASVFSFDALQKADRSAIFEYMWLTSDIPGNIESPGYYFSEDPDVASAADNLMLTYGWRKFNWDEMLTGENSFIKYLPEINGQLITGKIRDIRNDSPAIDTDAYLSVSGIPFGFYTSKSDQQGLIKFEVKDYYGNRQIIAQPAATVDSFYKVDIISPFAEASSGSKYSRYHLSEEIKNELLQKSISMQVQNIYSGDSLKNFFRPALIDTLPFYWVPASEYTLDDFKRFTTMEEVLREYVTDINVTMRNGKPELKIFDPGTRNFHNGKSLILLDGVPLSNPNQIFSYDPLKIKKLDVIQTVYILGKSTFYGIASFSTYNGVFDGFELDPRLVAIDYDGLQLQREFYSPAYETKEQIESRVPDFRNTLSWFPQIDTDREGKASVQLYSSDRKGEYIVIVHGMNKNGSFVSGSATFEVK